METFPASDNWNPFPFLSNTAQIFNIIIWVHCYFGMQNPFGHHFLMCLQFNKKKDLMKRRHCVIFTFYIAQILFKSDKQPWMNIAGPWMDTAGQWMDTAGPWMNTAGPTCSFWYISKLIPLISSSCCRSDIMVSCFSWISFSKILSAISISCFILICSSSSFSTSWRLNT